MALLILGLILAVLIGLFLVKTLIGFALMLVLAGLIGAAAQSVLGSRRGVIFSVGAGLVGAVVGTVLANVLGLPKFPELFNLPLLWTAIGSAAVVGVAKVVAPERGGKRLGTTRGLLR